MKLFAVYTVYPGSIKYLVWADTVEEAMLIMEKYYQGECTFMELKPTPGKVFGVGATLKTL